VEAASPTTRSVTEIRDMLGPPKPFPIRYAVPGGSGMAKVVRPRIVRPQGSKTKTGPDP
jgi:hypothetical protein